MTDIVERLRAPFAVTDRDAQEAVAEIERLRTENARLRETLQYIADPYHNSTTSKDRMAFLAREALRGGEG